MKITVQRLRETNGGIFGIMTIDTNPFTCFTLENLALAIPAGIYKLNFTWSVKFNRTMPHIIVPVRDEAAGGDAGIRIHPANFPNELEGCIAVGDTEEIGVIYNSRVTFNKLIELILGITDITIEVKNETV